MAPVRLARLADRGLHSSRLRGPVVMALAMASGAAGAVYVAERGQVLHDALLHDSDEQLTRAGPPVPTAD